MPSITINQGDTLSGIAGANNTTVDALLQANPNITNPNLIIAGESLNVPDVVSQPAQASTGLGDVVQSIPENISVADGSTELVNGKSSRQNIGEEIARSTSTEIEKIINVDIQSQRDTLREDIKQLQTSVSEREALLGDALTDDFDRNELMNKFREEANIKALEAGLNNILGQMNDKQLAYQNGRRALVGESSTMKLLRGKEALLKEQFDSEMTWLAGKASILQGNLARADSLIGQYFDNAVADRQDRINNLATLFDLDNQKLIRLSDEEKSLAKDQMGLLADINTRQEKEKDSIRQLMLDDTVSAVWDRAGVNMNMPLDEILTKIQPFVAQEQARRFNILHGDSSVTVDSGTFDENTFKNSNVVYQNESGEWVIDPDAIEQFYSVRGIPTKDRGKIYAAAESIADNLNTKASELVDQTQKNNNIRRGGGIFKSIYSDYINTTPALILEQRKPDSISGIQELNFSATSTPEKLLFGNE